MTELDKKLALEIATKAVATYAELHPRPSSVNIKQACKMLGKSRDTVVKIFAKSNVKMNHIGEIPISEIDRLIAAR